MTDPLEKVYEAIAGGERDFETLRRLVTMTDDELLEGLIRTREELANDELSKRGSVPICNTYAKGKRSLPLVPELRGD